MSRRRRATSRSRPGQRLLAAVMLAAMAIAGCGHWVDTAEKTKPVKAKPPLAAQATAASGGAPSAAVPPVSGSAEFPPPMETLPRSTSPPQSATGPATTTAATPVRLQIPAIGVDSSLMDLGLQADGTLEVPPDGFPAGWYTGAPTPGELGPAIIAGHVDWGGQPGVFFDLRELSPGDGIAVIRQDGSTARFRVTHIEQFDKDDFPTHEVYGDLDHAGLRLITCGGAFDQAMRSYEDNLVVFAELVDVAPA